MDMADKKKTKLADKVIIRSLRQDVAQLQESLQDSRNDNIRTRSENGDLKINAVKVEKMTLKVAMIQTMCDTYIALKSCTVTETCGSCGQYKCDTIASDETEEMKLVKTIKSECRR